ncbi:hypothetical protein QX201_007744 [Fusarium graminearum]
MGQFLRRMGPHHKSHHNLRQTMQTALHQLNYAQTRVTDALRNLLEWLRAQSETPKVTATTGTANSYCRFKEKTETLISLLRHLSEAYVSSEVEVEADAARHYDQELIINLNQTGVLDAVMDRHSATKSTAYALCGTVGGCSVVAIGYFALGLTGWPMIFASVVGVAVALAGGVTSCKHTEYRKRVRKVKDDFESFRRALKTVMRILALQFATSAGINSTIKDEHIRDDFLRRFGLDSRDINNEQYIMASLCMDVKCLDQAFRTFTENVDWIDEHEGLGLMRGVEAALTDTYPTPQTYELLPLKLGGDAQLLVLGSKIRTALWDFEQIEPPPQ